MAFEDIFNKAAKTYNVPVNLLKAVAKTESDFNPTAKSSAGAVGIMQLMPATAAGLGVTDRTDPEQNIMGGAKYLSQLLKIYSGDEKKALAAYNAGSNNVSKYGAEKYSSYYTKVLGYYKDYGSGTISDTGNSTTDSGNSGGNTNTGSEIGLQWWGQIVLVLLIILLLIFGLTFLYKSIGGNITDFAPTKIINKVKKVVG